MVTLLALGAVLAAVTFVPALQTGDTVPAIPLLTQTGSARSIQDLHGNAVLLSFIYTRCPDPRMCPLTSAKFARLQTLVRGRPIKLLEISLDPAYDSPRVLRAYGRAFGADPERWILATGSAASIDALAQRFSIATRWTQPGVLVHTEALVVLDPAGRLAQVIDGNAWSPADALAAATDAGAGPASFGARVRLWLGSAVERCGGGSLGVSALALLTIMLAAIAAAALLLFRALRVAPERIVRNRRR